MSHSLIGADRRTHFKIVVVALVGVATLIGVVGASLERPEPAVAKTVVVKAGKPAVLIAQADGTVRR